MSSVVLCQNLQNAISEKFTLIYLAFCVPYSPTVSYLGSCRNIGMAASPRRGLLNLYPAPCTWGNAAKARCASSFSLTSFWYIAYWVFLNVIALVFCRCCNYRFGHSNFHLIFNIVFKIWVLRSPLLNPHPAPLDTSAKPIGFCVLKSSESPSTARQPDAFASGRYAGSCGY